MGFDVAQVLFILGAVLLHQIGIREKNKVELDRKGLCEGLGIIQGKLQFHASEIEAMKALGEMQIFAVRMAIRVEPATVIESRGIDYKRVTFPRSH